jgi:hypothetical protein
LRPAAAAHLVIDLRYAAVRKGRAEFAKKAYEKETFAAIDFRTTLPMASPRLLLLCRDSNGLRVPRELFWFSARPLVPPGLPHGGRG